MKSLFFSLFISSLFATVNEPFRWEIFSGYRNDRIHWHLQESGASAALTYSELYRNVQYWEDGLVLKAIYRDLTFFLRGAYGAFGRGDAFQNYASLPSQPHFRFTTDGWAADGTGYFGYAINLTADRTYKAILIPLIGYSAHFEQLKRKNGSPPIVDGVTSSLPATFCLVWNGVLLGGGFVIEPGGRLIFNGGYSYHFIHNRVRTSLENSLYSQSIKTSSRGNKGHTGWAQMDWVCNGCWRMGIGAQIHYFFSRVVNATIQQSGLDKFSGKFKLRWTAISGWAQISRQF